MVFDMKKNARDLKKGDTILLADKVCLVDEIEVSEIGKHGKSKVRIVVITENKEKLVIIRPDDYVFDLK
jgi:translation elongation factor P/translation initiation factor 5A